MLETFMKASIDYSFTDQDARRNLQESQPHNQRI